MIHRSVSTVASILIIQDRDVVRALFREILERAGHEVLEASQGLEGIHQYRLLPTELVITDTHLPDCDGLDVIGSIRQEFPAVKILGVSIGAGRDDVLTRATMRGADAILQDALDGEALVKMVEGLLCAS